jgi:iron complex outermembrane recepter protein
MSSRIRAMSWMATGLLATAIQDAWAQTDSQQQAAQDAIQEIVVTGTLIRTDPTVVGSNVIAVDQSALQATGANSVVEMLRDVPQVSALGVNEASRAGTGGAGNITYGNSINIRGISPFATLTLLNGHRVPMAGTSGSTVDPDVIPSIMLQRVDIVADGASATYGSDAVAGVANLILRRRVQGVETSARYGWADDYNERRVGLLAGHVWDSGQFSIGFEDSFHSALNGQDRAFYRSDQTARSGGDYRTLQCNPGNIEAGGVTYAIPIGGVTSANSRALVPGTANLCDIAKYQDILPRVEHASVAATLDQTITDWLSLYGDAFYSRRTYRLAMAQATGPMQVPSTNPFFVAPAGATLSPCSPAPGAPSCEQVDYSFMNDAGPNEYNYGRSENYQATLGLRLKLGADWVLDADGMAGRDHDRAVDPTQGLNNGALDTALASSDPGVAFNPFGGPNSSAVVKGLLNDRFFAPGDTGTQLLEAKADGPIVSLPGGQVRAAAGVQWHHDELLYGFNSGVEGGADASLRVNLNRHSTAEFIELLVPFVGPDNAFTGIRALDLDVAGRSEDYSDFGRTSHPKIGLNWVPADGWKVHASYGTSFRAPLLSELVGPLQGVFVQTYSDPQSPSGTSLGYALGGGNPKLRPETATTWSFGIEFEPVEAAKLSATFFSIDYKNQIASYLSDLTILQQTAQLGSLVTRCPSAACAGLLDRYIGSVPVFGPVLASPSVFVDGQEENLGRTEAQGIDFQGQYRLPVTAGGNWSVGVSGSVFTRYDVQFTPGGPTFDELNHIGYPLRLRLRGNVGWQWGPLTTFAFINFANSYTNDQTTPSQSVGAYTTLDLDINYDLGSSWDNLVTHGLDLTLHINNLFDKDPPYVNIPVGANGGGGFDAQVGNPIGRLISLGIAKRF